ncbi:hypothetical protein ACMD2_20902, partial [Ananas comosus]
MALLSANLLSPNKTLIPSLDLLRNPNLSPISPLNPLLSSPPPKRLVVSASSSSFSAAAAASADPDLQEITKPFPQTLSNWGEFARRVSGEWDGFGAEFTPEGNPIELPESVVPEAFREWGVEVFDWQTQCPTLASESGDPVLCYKLIKLLPTVGCEADAATRHSVEERIAGSSEGRVSALGFDPSGSYVAAWPVDGQGGKKLLEVEHCLVDPANKEVRVRVIQVTAVEEEGMRLEAIRVFSEQWYGPFRNGEQLGGCAIRESGFASSSALRVSDVVGVWQGITSSVARFGAEQMEILQELFPSKPRKIVRDQLGLVTLPKQLWCSFKVDDGEITGEVGWLFDHGRAITSRCLVSKDRKLKA